MVAFNEATDRGTTQNLPWVEKYRPKLLEDLVSQKEIVKAGYGICAFLFKPIIMFLVSEMIAGDKLPHLLFYGPPGTGKTSTILAAARAIFTPKNMQSRVLEV